MCYCSLFVTFHVASDIDWCCSTHRQGFLGEDITLWLCDLWSLFSFPLEDVPQFPLSSWYSTDVIIIIVPSFWLPLMIITPIGRGKEKGMPPFYPSNFCSISYSFHLNFPPFSSILYFLSISIPLHNSRLSFLLFSPLPPPTHSISLFSLGSCLTAPTKSTLFGRNDCTDWSEKEWLHFARECHGAVRRGGKVSTRLNECEMTRRERFG